MSQSLKHFLSIVPPPMCDKEVQTLDEASKEVVRLHIRKFISAVFSHPEVVCRVVVQ